MNKIPCGVFFFLLFLFFFLFIFCFSKFIEMAWKIHRNELNFPNLSAFLLL